MMESIKTKLYKIITKYSDCFHKTVGRNPAKVLPLILEVDNTKWKVNKNKCGPRIQSVIKEKAIQEFIEQAKQDDVIEESQAVYVSQVLLTPKPQNPVTHTGNRNRFGKMFIIKLF